MSVCCLEKKHGDVKNDKVETRTQGALEMSSAATKVPHSTGLRAEMRRPRNKVVAFWAGVWEGAVLLGRMA